MPSQKRAKGERVAVRSVLYLRPKPGCRAALVEAFIDRDVAGQAMQQAGCLSVELQAPHDSDEGGPLLVTALWTDREAYDGWLANPWRAEASAALDGLLVEEPKGEVFDLLVVAGSQSGSVAKNEKNDGIKDKV